MENLSILIKPVSGSCDSRCRYCFYADITNSREIKNRGAMSLELLELIVQKALTATTKSCAFGFQGGEPTLAGLDFFRALIEFEKKHNTNGVKIFHALQTNGARIDNAWASFLAEHDFLTGLSIDAGKRIHDALRVDISGKGTHSRCMKAARLLSRHGARFNILSVVTKPLASEPDKVYGFYKENNFNFIQFIPCIDELGEGRAQRPFSLDARTYGAFLCRIFDLWHSDLIKGRYISIRAFDNYIHMLAGYPPENCGMAGVCNAYPLIEADGSVYPCDFYAVDALLLGNIMTHGFDSLLLGSAATGFNLLSRETHETCGECEYYPVCRGGCRRDREPLINGALSLNKYCEAYKAFFKHSLPRMKLLARKFFPS